MKRTVSICLAISATVALSLPAGARTRPHYGGTLRIESRSMPLNSLAVHALISEGLTSIDDHGRVSPLLADRWESQNDNRRWVFTIHPHVTMHDGTPLSGTVIAEILSSASAGAPWSAVRGTDTSVTLESDAPIPNLPALLASSDYSILRRTAENVLIATGPYRVASGNAANAVLEPNDAYWRGRGYADRIEYYGARAIRNQWLDLGVGRADIVEIPGEFLRRAQQEHLRTAAFTPGELVLAVVSPDIRDVKLRHAIALSIDRESLSGVVFQKQGEPTATLLPNSMTGYGVLFDAGVDLAAARNLRTQVKSLPALTISYDPSEPTMQLAAERIALNARDAGLPMQAVPQSGIASSSIKLIRVTLPSTDASACLVQLSHALLGQTLAPAPNVESLYAQERDLLENYQLIPLLHLPSGIGVADRVRDVRMQWDGADLPSIWIEERH